MLKHITQKPLWVNIIAAIVLIVLFFFLIIISLKWITRHGRARNVPTVTGKSFDSAQMVLNGLGFEVVIQDSIYQDDIPPLTVIKQVPEGDEVVKVNRTVYLTINRAVPPEVEVPNLIGYSFRNAEMVLKNIGLRVGDTSFKADFAKNSVLEQLYNGNTLAPGTKLTMGSEISLVLGSGVGQTTFSVPDLVGRTYGEAKTILESNGIIVVPIAPGISDTLNAFVERQQPNRYNDEGKVLRIRPGQMMTLFLSITKPSIDTTQIPVNDF